MNPRPSHKSHLWQVALWIKEKNEDLLATRICFAAMPGQQTRSSLCWTGGFRFFGAQSGYISLCVQVPPRERVISRHFATSLIWRCSDRRRPVSGRAPSGRCWRNPNATIGASRDTPSEGPHWSCPRTVGPFVGSLWQAGSDYQDIHMDYCKTKSKSVAMKPALWNVRSFPPVIFLCWSACSAVPSCLSTAHQPWMVPSCVSSEKAPVWWGNAERQLGSVQNPCWLVVDYTKRILGIIIVQSGNSCKPTNRMKRQRGLNTAQLSKFRKIQEVVPLRFRAKHHTYIGFLFIVGLSQA